MYLPLNFTIWLQHPDLQMVSLGWVLSETFDAKFYSAIFHIQLELERSREAEGHMRTTALSFLLLSFSTDEVRPAIQ